jgi:GNAT superfamily N-acetyltransferase
MCDREAARDDSLYMQIVDRDQYSVDGNLLRFPSLDVDPVKFPFGIGIGIRRRSGNSASAHTLRPRLRIQTSQRRIITLEMDVRGTWVPVIPGFSRHLAIRVGELPRLVIQLATTEDERTIANRIVRRGHYLRPRRAGVLLIARVPDDKVAHKIRLQWDRRFKGSIVKSRVRKRNRDEGRPEIVGALQLERLMHGHPAGRAAIYHKDGRRPPNRSSMRLPGFRRRVIRDLGLYWISRVAVEPAFRGLGVGSALCDAAREVAATRMIEPGRYIELIRRLSIHDFNQIADGHGDFLTGYSAALGTQLPFVLRTPYLSRKPSIRANQQEPRRAGAEGGDCLAYYFAKAGLMVTDRKSKNTKRRRPK